jgi:hypothetical protein
MPPPPIILFGAFDRHNLGDILLAWVASEELARGPSPRPVIFAGLAERDLTHAGGHKVRAIADLARKWGGGAADVLHVGGELLTCDLFQAAVMVQGAGVADAAMTRFAADPAAGMAWARRVLGLEQGMGYLVPKALFANSGGCAGRFEYRAVGGVDLAGLAPESRAEVLARLREADALSVRDGVTRDQLAAFGIDAALMPDPVSRVPGLFAERIRVHAHGGEAATMKAFHPRGYLALQFAAEYGDDAGLDAIARHMDAQLADTGLGLVLFRAGAAPWHDDMAVYRRLATRLPSHGIRLFQSLDVWDICALLAGASRYCGTSLHGWILSRAFGVETTPFPLPLHQAKLAAYQETWAPPRPTT